MSKWNIKVTFLSGKETVFSNCDRFFVEQVKASIERDPDSALLVKNSGSTYKSGDSENEIILRMKYVEKIEIILEVDP